MSDERVWQVLLPDGTPWIAEDARPGNPRASWIYARSTADMFARQLGGTVVEVTRRQKEKLLDQEIASVLAEPTAPAKATKKETETKIAKKRTRPLGRDAQRAIGIAILANVPLRHAARAAVDTARETAADVEYTLALKTISAGLPATLWVGYDARRDQGFAQTAEPVWITHDPQGEDPGQWRQIDRNEAARLLVEGA